MCARAILLDINFSILTLAFTHVRMNYEKPDQCLKKSKRAEKAKPQQRKLINFFLIFMKRAII